MNRLITIVLALLLSSCSLFQRAPDGSFDLAALADDVQAAREVVGASLMDATPATQEKVKKLGIEVEKLEAALRLAAQGGPISDVKSAASAALTLADQVVVALETEGHHTGDLRFWIGVVRGAMVLIGRGEKAAAVRDAMREAEAAAPPPQ